MYRFLSKRGQLMAFGLGMLVTLVFILGIMAGLGDFNALSEDDQKLSKIFNSGLMGALILTIVSFAAALIGGIWTTISNPKGSVKMLVGLGILILLFVIFFSTSVTETGGIVKEVVDEFGISDKISRLVSAGLKTTFVLIVVAFVSFVITELWNLVK